VSLAGLARKPGKRLAARDVSLAGLVRKPGKRLAARDASRAGHARETSSRLAAQDASLVDHAREKRLAARDASRAWAVVRVKIASMKLVILTVLRERLSTGAIFNSDPHILKIAVKLQRSAAHHKSTASSAAKIYASI